MAAGILVTGVLPLAVAVDVPPSGSATYIQTNGPIGALGLGDWYTSTAAGAGSGHHYLQFHVPCGWPPSRDVHVDLFSPEINAVAAPLNQTEEVSGPPDSTQFELYGVGAAVGPGYAAPAPGAGISGTRITYPPGAAGVAESWTRHATLSAPVSCGTYVLRSTVMTADPGNPGGTGNDQNGWRLRVGWDDDADPTDAPPATTDDADGQPGTNDEISLGMSQTSFQHDGGGMRCQTSYQYVDPGLPSIRLHNFDLDANGRVRYYPPGDPTYDATGTTGGVAGTVSGATRWNGSAGTARVGDTIVAPADGWWRLVTCASNHNQYIQEGQNGAPTYYTQPPTPDLEITKSDGHGVVSPGQAITYEIVVDNVSSGPSAGAATGIVVQDDLPSGATFDGCSVTDPADGTWSCSESGGVVTFSQTGWIAAGDAATLEIDVTLDQGLSGTLVNDVVVDYEDGLGNPFPQVAADDVDTVEPSADLRLVKTDTADPVDPGDPFDYELRVTNLGPADATDLVLDDLLPVGLSVTGVSDGGGSCTLVGNALACSRGALSAGADWVVVVHAEAEADDAGHTYTNTASISGAEADPEPVNDEDDEQTTVRSVADLGVVKHGPAGPVDPGDTFDYTLTVTNHGPADAVNVVLDDVLPADVSVDAIDGDGGTCSAIAGLLTCSWPLLTDGEQRVVVVGVQVDPSHIGGTITNEAAVSSDLPDPAPANDRDDVDTAIRSVIDLGVVVTDSADPVSPGESWDYLITVTNDGPADATGVALTFPVPAGLTIDAVDAGPGTCTVIGNVVECTLTALAGGASWSLIVQVSTAHDDPGGTYTVTAQVSGNEPDGYPLNDSEGESTEVLVMADLWVEKSVIEYDGDAGGVVEYGIVVGNDGPGLATNVIVVDDLPAELEFIGADASVGSFDASTGVWTVGTLGVDVSETLVLRARLRDGAQGEVVNRATVSSPDQIDPTPENDGGEASVSPGDVDDDGGWESEWGGDGDTAATGADMLALVAATVALAGAGIVSTRVSRRRR